MGMEEQTASVRIGAEAKREWCWPWAHQWQRWTDHAEGNVIRTHDGKVIGSFVEQRRRCEVCNAIQLRKSQWGG